VSRTLALPFRQALSVRASQPHHGKCAAMDAILRHTGIDPLGTMPWGTHVCLFYETKQDLLDTVIPFFKAGLESNELCVWAVSEPATMDDAKNALSDAIPSFERLLAVGSINIHPGREWYLKRDRLSVKRVLRAWNEKLQYAVARGYDGMRASGNAFWLETEHWKSFCEYESELDQFLAGQPMNALCTYPLTATKSTDVLDVVRAHQFTLVRRKGDWEFIEASDTQRATKKLQLNQTRSPTTPSTLRETVSGRIAGLTARERQVLDLVVDGKTNKHIASVLQISQRTVEVHRAAAMKKIGARSIAELIRLALVATSNTD